MKRISLYGLVCVSFIGFAHASYAQAPTPPAGLGQSETSVSGKSLDNTQSMKFTKIIVRKPTTTLTGSLMEAGLSEVMDDPRLKGKDLSKVVLNGSSTPVQTTTGRKVNILWDGVSRLDTNKTEKLAQPLRTSVEVTSDTAVIPRDQELNAAGDTESLVNAILTVLDDTKASTIQNAQDVTNGQDTKDQTQSGNTTSAPTASSKGPSNPIAASYKNPEVTPPVDITPVFGETSEGCEPRESEGGDAMIMQTQTVKDGIPQGNCSDSLVRLPIKTSYDGCPRLPFPGNTTADMPHGYYQATVKRYFVGTDGLPHDIDEQCQPSEDDKFPIQEDAAACGWDVNKDTLAATKQAKTYYFDQLGLKIPVSDNCVNSTEVATVTVTESKATCDPRNDMVGGWTYEKAQFLWEFNGKQESTICQETGVKWKHYPDKTVCDWGHNLTTGQAFPQYRTAYDNPDGTCINGTCYLDQVCQPDMANAVGLDTTVAGCENTFEDEFANQQSFGTHRFFYMNGSIPEYVSSCVRDASNVYPHKTKTTEWQCDDVTMSCLPKTEIYIATTLGDVTRSTAQIRPDAVASPYVFSSSGDVADVANTFYEGCYKVTSYIAVSYYNRPNGTVFEQVTGPGSTQSTRLYVCAAQGATVLADWTLAPYSNFTYSFSGAHQCVQENITCYSSAGISVKYQATRSLIREDETIIITDTKISSTLVSAGSVSGPVMGWSTSWGCSGITSSSTFTCFDPGAGSVTRSFSASINPPSDINPGTLKDSAGFLW